MVARFRNLKDAVRHVRRQTHAHPFYTFYDLVLPGPERDCLNGRMSRHGSKYEILRGFWKIRSDKKAH